MGNMSKTKRKSNSVWVWLGFFAAGMVTIVLLLASPALYSRISWRVDRLAVYARSLVDPVEPLDLAENQMLPQPRVAVTRRPTETPIESLTPTPATPEPTALPTLTPTPIPGMVSLPPPALEKQDINNCGPASLAMYLRYWGWEGDQFDISDRLKPNRKDRNVNVEELMQYAHTRAGWLTSEFRVGGSLELLKRLLAAGLPVMIEEGVLLDETYWANDDHWAAHYLLLTGYEEAAQTFTGQDSFFGANRVVAYEELDYNWQAFNRVFILIYPLDQQATVESILGPDWDVTANRQRALERAQAEIEQDPENAYAWFNQGTNLVFFERYAEAIDAFRRANAIGLPQRMLRYQFGPFIANFHNGRPEDLLTLTEYALKRTPNSEEALLWQGWGLYRQGKPSAALQSFQEALSHHPGYEDAEYAIEFVRSNP
jgi:tetratricopeptide (TPR) repeat protein